MGFCLQIQGKATLSSEDGVTEKGTREMLFYPERPRPSSPPSCLTFPCIPDFPSSTPEIHLGYRKGVRTGERLITWLLFLFYRIRVYQSLDFRIRTLHVCRGWRGGGWLPPTRSWVSRGLPPPGSHVAFGGYLCQDSVFSSVKLGAILSAYLPSRHQRKQFKKIRVTSTVNPPAGTGCL